MAELPTWMSRSLDASLEGVSRNDLMERSLRISEAYRAGGASDIIRTERDAMAYAIARMPATFAAVRASLGSTAELVQDLAPQTVLDVGAGPGTAGWACIDLWPSVDRVTLLDSNPRLLDLARRLHAFPGAPNVEARFVAGSIPQALAGIAAADVVVASYSLTEILPAALERILAELWRLAATLLVIVEPGTPDGFRRILDCRDMLISAGGRVVAPCTHDQRCPLSAAPRWCHFSKRLARSRDHLIAKNASVPFEDERFSYLAVAKDIVMTRRHRRILATPKVSKGQVSLTLCAPGVVEERAVARGDKQAYKAAKRYDWGDAFEH
jgi:ribosomal protein RSM22 (predicted rRNA methylase)